MHLLVLRCASLQVCYWLMRQKLQCQITACDTFRSGAVEQLRVHADKLCVPLFESGYGKDPSAIARAGIAKGVLETVNSLT